MTIKAKGIANPEVMRIPVAHTPGGPATDTLFICTGNVLCDFGPFDGGGEDDLEFWVPDEDGSPLSINPNTLLNSAATVSLAGIVEDNNDQGAFAVNAVDILQSDAGPGQILVQANLFVTDGLRISRVAYQVNLVTTPSRIK